MSRDAQEMPSLAQACLPVIKHSDGMGPALCLEAPGSVTSGCPAGVAARAVWWGERGAKRGWGRLLPWGACPNTGMGGEQCRAEPEQEMWHHPLACSPPSVGYPVGITCCGLSHVSYLLWINQVDPLV